MKNLFQQSNLVKMWVGVGAGSAYDHCLNLFIIQAICGTM